MRVVIAGSSGFLGTALIARLRDEGHDVLRLVRRPVTAPDEISWAPGEGTLGPAPLAGTDVVVNLAGAGIGDRRWTAARKREIVRSRVDATTTLSHALAAGAADGGPGILLNASAIGFYGDRGDERLDEDSPAGEGFLPNVCRAWEGSTQAAEEAGVRVVHLRTGLVLGAGGGLLGRMVPLFRAGIGGRLGTGRQWMSWISLADQIGAIRYLMDHDVSGAVNVTAPEPVRNREFTAALATVLRRPAILPVPRLGLRVAVGQFTEDVLASAQVLPTVLTGTGYVHRHPDVTAALRWALAG